MSSDNPRIPVSKCPQQFINQILCGDAKEVLKQLPSDCIDSVVTSSPYWALRDYGMQGQLGLEPTAYEYVRKLCDIFDEVNRVLKKEGTCWVNLGDTYSTRNSSKGRWSLHLQSKSTQKAGKAMAKRPGSDLPGKCLLQIPARFALEMINRGWILRNEIIWAKPNAMPQSVKDRFTVDFEKLFFFVKSRFYHFAQQFEPLRDPARLTRELAKSNSQRKHLYGDAFISAFNPATEAASRKRMLERGRNKRCVWRIATRPYPGNHFAVYPPELIETPIKAGCPRSGIVLDPFIGSGTTALVAQRLGRKFIGIDLNPAYIRMAQARLAVP